MIKNLKHVNAGDLSISYYEVGPTNGIPIILLHGFPYDIHAYKDCLLYTSDAADE